MCINTHKKYNCLHKLSYNRERGDDNNKIYVGTIVIAVNRQVVQLILNAAINMISHMYIILYIYMHTYTYTYTCRIPNSL